MMIDDTRECRGSATARPGRLFLHFNYLINFLLHGGYLAKSWCLFTDNSALRHASASSSAWHLCTWGYRLLPVFFWCFPRVSALLPQINSKTTNQSQQCLSPHGLLIYRSTSSSWTLASCRWDLQMILCHMGCARHSSWTRCCVGCSVSTHWKQ